MSWEYDETIKACPCGKGQIKETIGSNDWGQRSKHIEILCLECKEKKDKEDAIKKENYNIAMKKIEETLLYFKNKNFVKFKENFLYTKSKKSLWEIACKLGAEKQSLSNFYNHFISKEEYVNNLIRWDNLENIIKAMNIKDEKLDILFKEASEHIKPFDDEEYRNDYLRAKGKI